MRIWSVHPRYLDAKGMVAVWRETLLARNVLLGNTVGYRNHPQLIRFRATRNPLAAIDFYLSIVHTESIRRGYHFDESKFQFQSECDFTIPLNAGQLSYEIEHLRRKLMVRSLDTLGAWPSEEVSMEPHPLFRLVEGGVEEWEVVG